MSSINEQITSAYDDGNIFAKILLRFPENYRYIDLDGIVQEVDFIISQPRYNATYAPAVGRERRWAWASIDRLEKLVDINDYGVFYCDSESIVLKRQYEGLEDSKTCFMREIQSVKRSLPRS